MEQPCAEWRRWGDAAKTQARVQPPVLYPAARVVTERQLYRRSGASRWEQARAAEIIAHGRQTPAPGAWRMMLVIDLLIGARKRKTGVCRLATKKCVG